MSEPIIKKMTRYDGKYTLYLKIDEHNVCITISSEDAYDLLIHTKFKVYTDEKWCHVWEFEKEDFDVDP